MAVKAEKSHPPPRKYNTSVLFKCKRSLSLSTSTCALLPNSLHAIKTEVKTLTKHTLQSFCYSTAINPLPPIPPLSHAFNQSGSGHKASLAGLVLRHQKSNIVPFLYTFGCVLLWQTARFIHSHSRLEDSKHPPFTWNTVRWHSADCDGNVSLCPTFIIYANTHISPTNRSARRLAVCSTFMPSILWRALGKRDIANGVRSRDAFPYAYFTLHQ